MKLIRGLHNLKEKKSYSIVTIGNFDGVHLGHQKLLTQAFKISKRYSIPIILILFEPHPLEFLKTKKYLTRIMTLIEKIKYLSRWNIHQILCIKFNDFFSNITPDNFIINILINKLHVKFIIIGEDFRFGKKRNGNIDFLKKMSKKYKFHVVKVKSIYHNNIKISSTKIREALLQNKMKLTELLLGRVFSVYGRVIHGCAIGRKIGYPTANLLLKKNIALNNGVYAVRIKDQNNNYYVGISNIDLKNNYLEEKKILEVHILNQYIDLYGKKIEVFIYKKIRNKIFFNSIQDLQNQILQDIKIVKLYFKTINLLK